MRYITHKKGLLHIETPHGIINIRVGLTDRLGRSVDSISITPDRCMGEQDVKRVGLANTRLIQLKKKVGHWYGNKKKN